MTGRSPAPAPMQHRLQAGARVPGWIIAAAFLLMLAPLLATPVLPLIDLYNHVARFHVLAAIGSNPFLAENYAANWHLLPNIGFDLIAPGLLDHIPPLLLAKGIVATALAIQFSGILFLNRALTGRINRWSVIIAASIGYSFILNWGFVNYLLGFGLMLWTLGLWWHLRHRPALATALCALLAVAMLLAHGFAFALYGLMLGGLELGRWWLKQERRRLADLARAMALIALQALVPAALFLAMRTAQAQSHAQPIGAKIRHLQATGELAERIGAQLMARLESLVRVAETPWSTLDAALFVASAGLLAWALRQRRLAIAPLAWPALAIAAGLALILPNGLFGTGHLPERMPLLLVALFAAALEEPAQAGPAAMGPAAAGPSRWVALLAAIAAIRLAATGIGWSGYAQGFDDFRAVTQRIEPPGVLATVLVQGSDPRGGIRPRCQMYGPIAVISGKAAVPLFANPAQQPLLLRGRLKAYTESDGRLSSEVPSPFQLRREPEYYDHAVARIAAEKLADYLMICGGNRLLRPLPANLERLARQGDLAVYRIRR